ncbi:MAG: GNAT family N-acetyltransferase [Methanoregula sp.]|nr:MAG: GNAT family N-acetyltransferase [Methanoregula sp.]
MIEPGSDCIRLAKEQISPASVLLARAFFNDPKLTHLIPDPKERAVRAQYLFEFELMYGMIYGDVIATSKNMEGVAVWIPSQKSEITFWRAFRSGGFRLQKQLGTEIMDRLMSFSSMVDSLHNRHVPGNHSYLFFIGVDPSFQGRGYAGRLVRPVLAQLDKKKMSCYLNTQERKNISLYEHFGFQVIDQVPMPGTDIIYTGMIRPPGETA